MTRTIDEFEKVRNWGTMRGVGDKTDPQTQYQRFLQEGIEIHDALVKGDEEEFNDAVGDTIVTLVNLARTKGYRLEDGLAQAFNVIEKRKGITTPMGDFVRYGKLSPEDQKWCDEAQGNPGNEYFTDVALKALTKSDFQKA